MDEVNISIMPIIVIIIIIVLLCVLASCIKIVPQAHAYIVERLGGYLSRNSEDGAFTTEILLPQ